MWIRFVKFSTFNSPIKKSESKINSLIQFEQNSLPILFLSTPIISPVLLLNEFVF